MTLYSINNIKALCRQYHLAPSKQFGQHYLLSAGTIEKMIEAAEVSKDDTVVEIGPGFGILTFALAARVKKVLAFEIERKLQPYWEGKMKEYPNVEVVWGNFLRNWKLETRNWGFEQSPKQSLVSNFQFPISYKVLANLPYQITSRIIRLFLEAEHKPERMALMVQKEVAERICAKPGDMSMLAVSVQYYGEPKIVAQVSKGNFWPVPKVDSAIVHISTTTQQHENYEQFFRVVKAGFAHKRKQLWRNLASGLKLDPAAVKRALKEVAGDELVRAEELGMEEWRALAGVIPVHRTGAIDSAR